MPLITTKRVYWKTATRELLWFLTGDTEPATVNDEIIVKNGSVLFREGDVVDGQTLAGALPLSPLPLSLRPPLPLLQLPPLNHY